MVAIFFAIAGNMLICFRMEAFQELWISQWIDLQRRSDAFADYYHRLLLMRNQEHKFDVFDLFPEIFQGQLLLIEHETFAWWILARFPEVFPSRPSNVLVQDGNLKPLREV